MPSATRARVPQGAVEVFDLDARRAARIERNGGSRTVRWGGREWEFKTELPLSVIESFGDNDIVGAFRRILVDPDQAGDFVNSGDFSQADFAELLEGVFGLALPKSGK